MPAAPLLTLAEVKTHFGITSTTTDTVLSSLIVDVTAAIEGYTNRTLSEQAFTEVRDGRGTQRLKLANYPLVSFSSLTVDDVVVPLATDTKAPGYRTPASAAKRDVVLQGGYSFTEGLGNVVLSYTAGYGGSVPWPADMKLAALEGIGAVFKARNRQGTGSKTLGTENITYNDVASSDSVGKVMPLVATACAKLANYKNVVPDL